MKTDLVDALYDVPEVLLNRIFGNFDEIAMPETEEDAVIAMGKLSANLNNLLLKPLSGLDVVELLLRVGQRNSTAISLLLSNLEALPSSGKAALEILTPQMGESIDLDTPFMCKCATADSVLVTLKEGFELELTADGDTWSGRLTDALAAGDYTATFTATAADKTYSKSVTFRIGEAIITASLPAQGASYTPQELTSLNVTLAEAVSVDSVSVSVFGYSWKLESQNGGSWTKDIAEFSGSLLGLMGLHTMLVDIQNADGTNTRRIDFTLFAGEEP